MECFLHCCDGTHDPISLPDGEDIKVGRKPELHIKNAKCSRDQVQLTANYGEKEVKVKQLGKIPSSIGEKKINKGETALLGPGGKICLLHKKYPHSVYFKNSATTMRSPVKNTAVKNSIEGSKEIFQRKHNQKRKIEKSDDDDYENNTTKKAKTSLAISDVHVESKQDTKLRDNIAPYAVDIEDHTRSQSGTPCTTSTWEEVPEELLIYTSKGVEGRPKVLTWMEHSLPQSQEGFFPTNTADWKIALPQIPGRLKKLWNQGYKIVIFTNQNGIAKKKVSVPDFKKKIENVVGALSVPIQVLISPGTGHYRKPSMGMWKHLCKKLNQGVNVVKKQSCYIGDAAGRPVGWASGKKKDFSCSDRAFAVNIGIKFQTPEEFFLEKKPAPFKFPAFDPKTLDANGPLYKPTTASLIAKEKEVIVMVGFPASGKSTFCVEHLVPRGYVRVNRDTLGTWQKCVTACRNALAEGKSVVVDNTNPDKQSRTRYIECAQKAKVPIRCFLMDVPIEHAQHNNTVRETLNTDKNYKHVGAMVFNFYKSSYVEPSCDEGFKEILRIQFRPKFQDTRTKDLYNQFL